MEMETETVLITNRNIPHGDKEHPEYIIDESKSFEEVEEDDQKAREYQRKLKEELFKEREIILQKNRKPIGIFKLIYFEASASDKFVILVALIASMGSGCVFPLFAILFGDAINKFANITSGAEYMQVVSELCLKFVYAAIGLWCAGFLMVWCWTYLGRITVRKLKENYFMAIIRQEQKWFDETDPFQFATKIQTQCTTMETGVNIN
jgi:ABC-type multidrug transport system fused ATPase/permease subunit